MLRPREGIPRKELFSNASRKSSSSQGPLDRDRHKLSSGMIIQTITLNVSHITDLTDTWQQHFNIHYLLNLEASFLSLLPFSGVQFVVWKLNEENLPLTFKLRLNFIKVLSVHL